MKTCYAILFLFLTLSLFGQFSGYYTPANWSLTKSNLCDNGFVVTTGAPNSIEIWSSQNPGCRNSTVFYGITAAVAGIVTFDWNYTTFDTGGSRWDLFGYFNGAGSTQLSVNGFPDGSSQNGTVSFAVTAGQTFGFYMNSVDNLAGRARSRISNFTAPFCDLELTVEAPSVIYYGYAPFSCTNVTATATSSNGPVTITGVGEVCATSADCIEVTVTAVDEAGCEVSETVIVPVMDVVCPNGEGNPRVKICHNGNSICVSPNAVPALLAIGASLGYCGAVPNCQESQNSLTANTSAREMSRMEQEAEIKEVTTNLAASIANQSSVDPSGINSSVANLYPNPAKDVLTYAANQRGLDGMVTVRIMNLFGQVVQSFELDVVRGANTEFDIRGLHNGQYTIIFEALNGFSVTEKFVVAGK